MIRMGVDKTSELKAADLRPLISPYAHDPDEPIKIRLEPRSSGRSALHSLP